MIVTIMRRRTTENLESAAPAAQVGSIDMDRPSKENTS